MKMLRFVTAAALLLFAVPAFAQWQTPNHSVPIGRGGGTQGFSSAAPGTAGKPFVSTGPSTDPAFGNIANSGFTAGAANTAKGSLDGANVVDLPLPPCTAVNQAWRYSSGVGINCGTISVTTGFDTPINLGLSSSAAGGALTINVTQADGTAPTSSNPVLVPFRSLTATAGTVTYRTVASPLTLTVPSGATLGTVNSVPFRIWVFLDANGGTPAVGVATCSNASTVFGCASWEGTLKTTTTISSGAGAGGVLYAAAGVTLDAVRIVGYCDFANGLAAVGTWDSSCTTLQVFGPGIKKPGDIVQQNYATTGTASTGTGVFGVAVATNSMVSISPQTTVNPIRISVDGVLGQGNTGAAVAYGVYKAAGASLACTTTVGGNLGTNTTITGSIIPASIRRVDLPASTSQVTYGVCILLTSGTTAPTWCNASGVGASTCSIQVEEIQG